MAPENFGLSMDTWEKVADAIGQDPNVQEVNITRDSIQVELTSGGTLELHMDLQEEDR